VSGLLLCRCGHEARQHEPPQRRRPEPGACLVRLPSPRSFNHYCPCVRFVEGAFTRQQVPLLRDLTPTGLQ
jgi:hypothetical protein